MNDSDISQKLDSILGEQKKLRTLVDKVEVNILNEVVKNRREIAKNTQEIVILKTDVKELKVDVNGLKTDVSNNTNAVNNLIKEAKGVKDILKDHQERIISLEVHCPSPILA